MSDLFTPSAALRERVLALLAERGLLRRRRSAPLPLLGVAALVTLAFGLGWGAARLRSFGDEGPHFLLLLSDEPGARAMPAELLARRIDAYRHWAAELAGQGRLVGAEKLKDESRVLGALPAGGAQVSGYFRIRASSLDEAVALARTCPHLGYGGSIAVREVDPV